MVITREYLRANPNSVFVFGDNLLRQGRGGAAILRNELNTRGFITKKAPNNEDSSFYRPDEYRPIFQKEMYDLAWIIFDNPDRTYFISKLGAGLANRYKIWENVIQPGVGYLRGFPNVVFLWEV